MPKKKENKESFGGRVAGLTDLNNLEREALKKRKEEGLIKTGNSREGG